LWYEEWSERSAKAQSTEDPLLRLSGSGKRIWADEPADEYVERQTSNLPMSIFVPYRQPLLCGGRHHSAVLHRDLPLFRLVAGAPDAIQLACAGSHGVDLFVTNDVRFHGKQVDGIQFITPIDRVPI